MDAMRRSMPAASKLLFHGRQLMNESDSDEDMFAIDQSPMKRYEEEKQPDLNIGRVRNFCDENLILKILKPAAKIRFLFLSGKSAPDEPEEVVLKPADYVGLDLSDKVRW